MGKTSKKINHQNQNQPIPSAKSQNQPTFKKLQLNHPKSSRIPKKIIELIYLQSYMSFWSKQRGRFGSHLPVFQGYFQIPLLINQPISVNYSTNLKNLPKKSPQIIHLTIYGPIYGPRSQESMPPMAAPSGMDSPKVKMAGTTPSAAPTTAPAVSPVAPPVAPSAAAPPQTPAAVAWTWPSYGSHAENQGKNMGNIEKSHEKTGKTMQNHGLI